MLTDGTDGVLERAGIDGVALKPLEVDVSRGTELPADMVTVDWEGRQHLPDADLLASLGEHLEVRVTTPVRADGFDPLGDDSLVEWLPSNVERVLIAGNPAYLSEAEKRRAIAPRLRTARDRAPDAWVGTEGIERLALAVGGTQFELLSKTTERDVRSLRASGFDGEIAVYAPTVLAEDDDDVLDALGGYVSRRGAVRAVLPDDAPTDASATGRAREVLLRGCADFALVGSAREVAERTERLREAGADRIVGYPARGLGEFIR